MRRLCLYLLIICSGGSATLAQVSDFNTTDFSTADSIAKLYPKHPLRDIKVLSEKLTNSLTTDQEKFRAIYLWVCHNIDNDYMLFLKNRRKRERLSNGKELKQWNAKLSREVFTNLLNKYKTVCTGYALLLKELANCAGLECEIIHGYGRTAQANIRGNGVVNHSWNAVKLNNKWYLCDATWSSGAIDTQKKQFVKEYDDNYFLLHPALFVRNHYPLDTTWMLLNDKPTLQHFLNRPLIYSDAYKFKIEQLSPDTIDVITKKHQPILFEFKSGNNNSIASAELHIKGVGDMMEVAPDLQCDTAHRCLLSHSFTSKGRYVVHLVLDKKYIATYTVSVK